MKMPQYEYVGIAIFVFLAVLPSVPAIRALVGVFARVDGAARRRSVLRLAFWILAAGFVYGLVVTDAFLVEPHWPKLERIELHGNVSQPLRVLQLSDLHIERTLPHREKWLKAAIALARPDLILLTGDIHQMDNLESKSLRGVLDSARAPLGVFACVGYDNTTAIQEAAPHIRFLCNESVVLQHGSLRVGIAGLLPVGERGPAYKAIESADYRILMNHTPDLADEAAAQGADLYLCGHTHGGQVRIPFWGAIITNAASGKRYEAGLYHKGNTTIYTSRGLGLEPPPAPQVRFLSRPEVTLFIVEPSA